MKNKRVIIYILLNILEIIVITNYINGYKEQLIGLFNVVLVFNWITVVVSIFAYALLTLLIVVYSSFIKIFDKKDRKKIEVALKTLVITKDRELTVLHKTLHCIVLILIAYSGWYVNAIFLGILWSISLFFSFYVHSISKTRINKFSIEKEED